MQLLQGFIDFLNDGERDLAVDMMVNRVYRTARCLGYVIATVTEEDTCHISVVHHEFQKNFFLTLRRNGCIMYSSNEGSKKSK